MIPKRDYTIGGKISADIYDTAIRACDDLSSNYIESCMIQEAMDDVAERVVPIFRDDLHQVIWDLEYYIAKALDEGLIKTDPSDFSLLHLIQIGYCEFLVETLSENLKIILFNHLVQTVNEDPNNEPFEEEVEEAIEHIVLMVDHSSTFAIYEQQLQEIISGIKAKERSNTNEAV